jgi:hypothetical protein
LTLNDIRHLHTDARVVALWCRVFGPVLRHLGPERRRLLLGLAAAIAAIRLAVRTVHPRTAWERHVLEVEAWLPLALLGLAFVAACYLAARRFRSLPVVVQRRPLVFLHAVFWLLLLAAWNAGPTGSPLRTTLLAFCALVPFLIWRLCYMFQTAQRGGMAGTRFVDHALYVWPIWGGTNTPYGKGLDYLRSTEARDEESLARSQLAGIKLFVLALGCAVGHRFVNGLVFGSSNVVRRTLGGNSLDLPTIGEILNDAPGAHAAWEAWVAIYGDLFVQVLKLAATGHVIIGYLRLCGFYVFRNTYKPLLAESIVEFWNRYYYYFKELLVHFFFLPVFARHFKGSPRLRLFAAVFASACLGNLYYHLIQDDSLLAQDWAAVEARMVPRALYCVLLAAGIYASMLRAQGGATSRGPRPWARRCLAIFGVWSFYAIIRLWLHGEGPLLGRVEYLLPAGGVQ